jgi:MFS family permease
MTTGADIGEKLWTREYGLITCSNFFMSLNFFSLLTIMPKYALDVFHMSEAQAGFVAGLFIAGILSARLFAASAVNYVGYKRMLSVGLVLLVAVTLGYFTAGSPALLCVIRFLHGVSYGMTSNTNLTVISNIIPEARRGEGLGYYSLVQVLSSALGPFVGLNLANSGNYGAVFIFGAVLPAVNILFLPFLRLKGLERPLLEQADRADRPEGDGTLFLDRFIERRVVPVGLITMLLMLFNAAIMTFMAVFASRNNLTEAAAYYFIVNAVVVLISRPFVSKLYDRRGPNFILYPAFVVYSAGFLILSQSYHAATLLIAAAVFGMGFGTIQIGTMAFANSIVPRHRLGLANATYYFSIDLSSATGPMIAGLLIPLIGFRGLFLTGFFMALLGGLAYHLLYGRKQSFKKEE